MRYRMQTIIDGVLEKNGYEKISCNIPSIALYIQQTDSEETPVIISIDETQGLSLSLEQFEHISEQLREFLMHKMLHHCIFLYLLITDDDSSAGRLFPRFENFWRIAPLRGIVMAYEDADALFTPLQRQLEAQLFEDSPAAVSKRDIKHIDKYPFVTIALVAVNVLIFLYSDLLSGNTEEILDWGALGYQSITEHQEWYRFITCIFLHSGIDHIFSNMLALIFIGSYLESYLGHGKYLFLYFSAGLLADCTSILYNVMISDPTSSVGASGAIFGVMGGLVVAILQSRRMQQQLDYRRIGFMIFFSLYGGFMSQGVDNSAHVGGFLSGVLLCILLSLKQKGKQIHDKG